MSGGAGAAALPATPQPAATPPPCAGPGHFEEVPRPGQAEELVAPGFETPGTPGLKTTPLPRQRPVPPVQQRGLLGRTPFLLPFLNPGGRSSAAAAPSSIGSPATAELQPLAAGLRGRAGPAAAPTQRSRFASAENDESQSLRESTEAPSLGSPAAQLDARPASFTSAFAGKGPSSSLEVAARSNSFASFGGNSSGNLQVRLCMAADVLLRTAGGRSCGLLRSAFFGREAGRHASPSGCQALCSVPASTPPAVAQLVARAGSFSSFGGSSGNVQLAARAGSLSSLGGNSSASLPTVGSARDGSCSPVGKVRSRQALLDGSDAQPLGAAPTEEAGAAAALGEQMQRLQLAA